MCQADLLNVRVQRPVNVETTAAGAAITAGLGSGVFGSLLDVGQTGGAIDRELLQRIECGATQPHVVPHVCH